MLSVFVFLLVVVRLSFTEQRCSKSGASYVDVGNVVKDKTDLSVMMMKETLYGRSR